MKRWILSIGVVLILLAGFYFFISTQKENTPPLSKEEIAEGVQGLVKNKVEQNHYKRMEAVYKAILLKDPDNTQAKKELQKIQKSLKRY